MKTRINGEEVAFEPSPRTMASEVIRDVAGLTGTKVACESGVCGSCTIRLDGTPVVSCILPAWALEGREVGTVEGVGGGDVAHEAGAAGEPGDRVGALHPVQKAFVAMDALQCGFCTPGFVVEAVAFYERWRAEGHGRRPTDDEVVATLAGHLCRCGAYPAIREAVARACAGDFDDVGEVHGPRIEASEKVTGRARYTVDVRLDGQLEGVIVRSTHPHARIGAVDLEPARAIDGVVSAVELLHPSDRVVRYVGEPVAAVAATSSSVARRAAAAVTVEYDPLPFTADMDEALTGTVTAYEGKPRRTPNTYEGPIPPGRWTGNVRRARGSAALSVRPGRARSLIRRAADDPDLVLVSGTYETSEQIHTALEPHAAVALWPRPDAIRLYVSTQSVDHVTRELMSRYRLKRRDVDVIAEHVGGGFGAKQGLQEIEIAALELSRAAGGAPVRVVNDRREEMAIGGHRPANRIEVDLVANAEDGVRALRLDALGGGGVGVNSTVALLARLFYPSMPKVLVDRDVVTNLPPGKPFRAPYGLPFFLATETSIDDAALELGVDPIELRRRWDGHPLRAELYDWAGGLEAWKTRGEAAAERGRFRRGVGVAMGAWTNFYYAGTGVEVRISAEEGIVATRNRAGPGDRLTQCGRGGRRLRAGGRALGGTGRGREDDRDGRGHFQREPDHQRRVPRRDPRGGEGQEISRPCGGEGAVEGGCGVRGCCRVRRGRWGAGRRSRRGRRGRARRRASFLDGARDADRARVGTWKAGSQPPARPAGTGPLGQDRRELRAPQHRRRAGL